MAKQEINLGTAGTDSGDLVRNAFDKCNDNFRELYNSQNLDHYDPLGYNKIFVLPGDFLQNGDSSTYNYYVASNGGYGGIKSSSLEPHATYMIPKGKKITKARMNANSSSMYWYLYTSSLGSSSSTQKGGNLSFNSEITTTTINASETTYVVVKLNFYSTSQYFYGGYLKLSDI